MEPAAVRLRRVAEDDHAFSLGDLDTLGRTAEARSAKGRLLPSLSDPIWGHVFGCFHRRHFAHTLRRATRSLTRSELFLYRINRICLHILLR